jgi:hypothetical protein
MAWCWHAAHASRLERDLSRLAPSHAAGGNTGLARTIAVERRQIAMDCVGAKPDRTAQPACRWQAYNEAMTLYTQPPCSRHVDRRFRHDGRSLHGKDFPDRTGVTLIHRNRHHPVPGGPTPIANL